ncbi:MAG: chorismate mutase [Actinomycetota bacterium]|nr:chorismate mutase [Actinomycetota bacterium]
MKSKNDFKEKLNEYREEIDKIDKNIVDLLNRRAVVVMEIKKLKEERNIPLYDARREDELLENIIKYNKGPLYSDNISQIFECILRNVQVLKKDENL